MITRRTVLERTLSAAGLLAIPAWAAKGEFWNEKPADSWSSAEIERLLARSPWAKDVELEFDMEGFDGPPGGGPPGGFGGGPGGGGPGGGPPGGGPPGGGFPGGGGPPGGGFPPGGGPPPGGPEGMKTTVRWESAKPIREVRKKLSAEDVEKNYVIGLFGGPLTMMRNAAGRGEERDPERAGRRAPDPAEMKANLEKNTQLQIHGKETLHPEKMVEVEDGLMIFFSRDDHPIKVENRDVTFQTKLGPLRLRAKFSLKEMVYRKGLEL